MENESKKSPFTFIPEQKNRVWLEETAAKNRRSMSAEINIALERAMLADDNAKKGGNVDG